MTSKAMKTAKAVATRKRHLSTKAKKVVPAKKAMKRRFFVALPFHSNKRAMASGAAGGAPLVEHAEERRRALDGECYTMKEFRQFYQKPHGRFSA